MSRLAALALALALVCAGPARGEAFADLVRELNTQQNRMVKGDATARQAIIRQTELIEKAIAAAEPESWREEQNVRAAAIYLLCGGAPAQLREIFAAGFFSEEMAPLIDASLRHAEGRSRAAAQALLAFNARNYPPILGGHLALVQGGALLGVDKEKATPLLDLARLLMPASLVEEAALRREVGIVDPALHNDKFMLIASRYAANYAASPYAASFWRDLRTALLQKPLAPEKSRAIDALLQKANDADRFDIQLSLARGALLSGQLETAKAQLDKAQLAASSPAAQRRIGAYRAALAALLGEASAPATVDLGDLPREDAEALKLLQAVVARLEAPAASAGAEQAPTSPLLVSAQQALARADALLRREPKR